MYLLFSDLDDTLLNNQSQVSPETKAFLDKFLAAGNRLALSSGRPLLSVLEVKQKAGLNQPGIFVCCSNGSIIYDCDRQQTIMKAGLPLSYVSYLQEHAKALSLHIHTYRDGIENAAVISPADDEEIHYYRQKIHLPLVISENLTDALTEEPCKMLAISLHNRDKLEVFRQYIAKWAENKIRMIYSSDKYLELFDWNAGKGSAVHILSDSLGIPLSHTFAVGDADNDISMLEAAGCGIAMRNATDNVKAHADIVTDLDNDHNGLADTLSKLLLL